MGSHGQLHVASDSLYQNGCNRLTLSHFVIHRPSLPIKGASRSFLSITYLDCFPCFLQNSPLDFLLKCATRLLSTLLLGLLSMIFFISLLAYLLTGTPTALLTVFFRPSSHHISKDGLFSIPPFSLPLCTCTFHFST